MDDLILRVKQISQYPNADAVSPKDEVVIQQNGAGGPYKSSSILNMMSGLVNSIVTFGTVDVAASLGFVNGVTIHGDATSLSAFDNGDKPLFMFDKTTGWLPQLKLSRPPNAPDEAATAQWVAQNTVLKLNGRTGNVTLEWWDFAKVGGAPILSPQFAGCPTTPDTLDLTDATARISNTKFVQDVVAELSATVQGQFTQADAQFEYINNVINDINANVTALQQQSVVASFNGRNGAVSLTWQDVVAVGGVTAMSPNFVGWPTAPLISDPYQDDLQIANTAFVQCAVKANIKDMLSYQPLVFSFNNRVGQITLLRSDIIAAGGAPAMNPALTGHATATTTWRQSNNDTIATTRWVRRFGTELEQDLEILMQQAVTDAAETIAQGPPGPPGPHGPLGPDGPPGPPGTGLTVKGTTTNPLTLPVTGNELGDLWLVLPSGDGYLWVDDPSVGPPNAPQGWLALGPVQGPQGVPGPQGQTGPAGPPGPQGDPGAVGPGGPIGPIGPIGPTGPQGADGAGVTPGGTAPSNPVTGDIWFDTSTGNMNWFNGTDWVPVGAGGDVTQADLTSALANYLPLAGSTMTGPITFAAGQTMPGYLSLANGGAVAGFLIAQAGLNVTNGLSVTSGGFSVSGNSNFSSPVTLTSAATLTLGGNAVNNLHAVPLQQLNSSLGNYLPLSGGTMTGAVTFASGQAMPGYLPLAGGTMTGPLTIWDGDVAINRNGGYAQLAIQSDWAAIITLKSGSGRTTTVNNFDVTVGQVSSWQSDVNRAFVVNRYIGGLFVDAPFIIAASDGLATVLADPTAALGVATKQYVDNKVPTITSIPSNIVLGVAADFSASITLATTDNGTIKQCTSAGDVTVTCPNNLAKNFYCTFIQSGAGAIIFAAGSNATVNNRQTNTKSAGQFAICSLVVTSNTSGTNAIYTLGGDTGS